MTQETVALLRIKIRQEGEHYYAASDDLPGLHVGGFSAEQACESALRAVRVLFKANRGLDVDVFPVADDALMFPTPVSRCERFVVRRLSA